MDILTYILTLLLSFCLTAPIVETQTIQEPIKEPVLVVQEVKKGPEYIGEYRTSGYYAPLGDQTSFYLGSYEEDKRMNCGDWDCFTTASGYKLSAKDELLIAACPRTFDFWTRLLIDGLGEVVCQDRGGSIKGRRLDIWNGIGRKGLENIKGCVFPDAKYKVYIIK